MQRTLTCALAAILLSALAYPQEPYRLPPPEVVRVVDAAPPPSVRLSPDNRWMLLVERDALPELEDLSRRMLRLAGMRIDPAANARYRTGFDKGLLLRRTSDSQARRVPLPDGARLASVSWSHKSDVFSYTLVTDTGTELWVSTVEEGAQPRRLATGLNPLLVGPRWMPDGRSILCAVVPEGRGAEPAAPKVPAGPNVQESSGERSPVRTYQDLLGNPYDEALFEHYAVAELHRIGLDGSTQRMAGAGLYTGVSAAPGGEHLLVTRAKRPFSYLFPLWRFPQEIQVWDRSGRMVYEVADVPLGENIPIQGVRTGPRSVQWKPGEAATLVWAEALDGGDPNVEAEERDRWMTLAAPFQGQPREMLRTEHRAQGLRFFPDPSLVLARDYDRDRRWMRSMLYDLDEPGAPPRILEDRSVRDRYGDPGRMLAEPDDAGMPVVRVDGDAVYRVGSGASKEGMLPFLDRQSLSTLETERLWRCEPGAYESVAEVLPAGVDGLPRVITRHESPDSPPNYRLRDLKSGETTALTDFPDPTPELRGIHKELVTYERNDGVALSATLYLPADYQEGTRLPLLVWAYPIEFNDPQTAGQVGTTPWRFTRIAGTSHLHLLSQGYAILDGATMPIVGDPETMNDTFREQLVASAEAAIRKAVDMGVADPDRAAVGGHSYGAFMTANLLAHSDLFRTGIARSGAYNRTLTPFGFQSERRTVWEAPSTYFKVSPFLHAEKINEPMLMIHGERDNNSGTFPMQSERMFQAIKGNGGRARLVMLPLESHGYRARESVLHVLAEMIDWLDVHLKAPAAVEAGYSGSGG